MASYRFPLVLVRHGVTDWNIQDRYQGTTDTVLNEKGRAQAEAAGERLARWISQQHDDVAVITSPLKRARESAALIASALGGVEVTEEPALRELSMGRWEGLNNLVVKERFYEERKARKRDRWHFAPVGGESLAARCQETDDLLRSLAPNSVIVAHAGTIRLAYHLLVGEEREKAAARAIPHGVPLLFDGKEIVPL